MTVKGPTRRGVLLCMSAAIVAVGPQVAALPKSPVPTSCPDGEICVWDAPAWQGTMTVVHSHECLDQRVMSAVNGRGVGPSGAQVLLLWTQPGCQGDRDKVVVPNQNEPVLNEMSFEVDSL